MNINHSNSIHSCTSCQLCGAICPNQAITIELNEEGFYRPLVNNEKCTNCGLCMKTCYKFDDSIHISSKEEIQRTTLYAASAKEDDIIANTTSGGIGDLLVKELIKEGYKVMGVTYNYSNDRAIHQIADDLEATSSFRGSKYIQPYCVDALREVIRNYRHMKFAIFALPCQIYAISKYLDKRGQRKQCILIDLYCHGCPSIFLWDKTAEMIKQKLGCNRFDRINFRSKQRGWGTFVIEAEALGKKYISSPLNNGFFDLFFSNQILNNSCADCKLRGTLFYSDMRLGDFWGKNYRKNTRGISAVTISTNEGQKLFEKISADISYIRQSYDIFLPYQSWNHVYYVNDKLRKELITLLKDKEKDIQFISNIINRRKSINNKGKAYIKQLLSYLPIKFAALFRR